jgi:hypothetical protein
MSFVSTPINSSLTQPPTSNIFGIIKNLRYTNIGKIFHIIKKR